MKSIVKILFVPLFFVAVVAGCDNRFTRPDQQAFSLDAKVTAADAAVVKYVQLPNCKTNANVQPCARSEIIKKLDTATTALGHAMDSYVQAAQNQTGSSLDRYLADVNAALTALTLILAKAGVTP